MFKSYNYRLYPTKQQEVLLQKSFGSCRFVYNWALSKKNEHYQTTGKSLTCFDLMKLISPLSKQEGYEWLCDINAQALRTEISHLDGAFTRFFKGKSSFPKFKSKHHSKKSFSNPQGNSVDFEKGLLKIRKFSKGIKCVFDRTFDGEIKTVTISQSRSGRYFASVLVEDGKEFPIKATIRSETSLGLDVGLKHFVVLSDGEKVDNPKYLRKLEVRLKVMQRRLSRKQKGSSNRSKARLRVSKLHEQIANQRKDFHHKLSSRIVRENQTICVEDLNVSGMMKNHCLAKSISDVGWSQFKEFLRYKCEWYGKNFIEIGRFEPSSKMCSCGVINNQLILSNREWTCGDCGVTHDRDLLAANNIKRFGLLRV